MVKPTIAGLMLIWLSAVVAFGQQGQPQGQEDPGGATPPGEQAPPDGGAPPPDEGLPGLDDPDSVPMDPGHDQDLVPQQPSEEGGIDRSVIPTPEDFPDGRDDPELLEQWRAVMRFGTDAELEELFRFLAEERDDRVAESAADLLTDESVDDSVRQLAVEYFDAIESAAAEDAAVELLQADADLAPQAIVQLVRYLGSVVSDPSEDAMDQLKELARHPDEHVRARSIAALGDAEVSGAVDLLLEAIDAESTEVRLSAVQSLGSLGDERAVEPLVEVAANTLEVSVVRHEAVKSLGAIGDQRAAEALQPLVDDEDAALRANAAAALAKLEGEDVSELLAATLRDRDPAVREVALSAIADAEIHELVDAVAYRARRDTEEHVRTAALEVLGSMGSAAAWETVEERFEDDGAAPLERLTAAQVLIDERLEASIDLMEDVVADLVENDPLEILEPLAGLLAEAESDALTGVYRLLLEQDDEAILQTHAVRGVARNGMKELRPEVERVSNATEAEFLMREAEDALSSME